VERCHLAHVELLWRRTAVVTWTDEDDLHEKVVAELCAAGLGLERKTRGAICGSFGAGCDDDGLPSFTWGKAGEMAERWQLLSPVRAGPGGVAGLNRLVRLTWRNRDVRLAARAYGFVSPTGADQIVFADKVMCPVNDWDREAWRP
jgi:hypothetical protein